MAKASDNRFPYVHLTPAAAPSSPSAGAERLYLDSGDGNKLKRKNSAGTVVTVEGGGGGSPTFVGVKAYRSASYNLADSAVTVMPWDAEEWDTDGFHDNTTNNNRLTVPSGQAGKYACKVNIGTDVGGVTYTRFIVMLRKNGTVIRGGVIEFAVPTSGTFPMAAVSCDVDLAVGDYVDAAYYQNSSGTRNFYNAQCALSMYKIG